MAYRRQEENDPILTVAIIIGMVSMLIALFVISNSYDLVDGGMVRFGLTALVAIALTMLTLSILGFSPMRLIEDGESNKITNAVIAIFWICLGYGAITQATLRYLNIRLDKSEEKIEEYVVKEKHRYVHHGKKNKISYSYALDVSLPGSDRKVKEIKLHNQRELDKFNNGDYVITKTREGYFHCPYIMEVSSRPAPKREKYEDMEKKSVSSSSFNRRPVRTGSSAREARKDYDDYFGKNTSKSSTASKRDEVDFSSDDYYSNGYKPSYKNSSTDESARSRAFNRNLNANDY